MKLECGMSQKSLPKVSELSVVSMGLHSQELDSLFLAAYLNRKPHAGCDESFDRARSSGPQLMVSLMCSITCQHL